MEDSAPQLHYFCLPHLLGRRVIQCSLLVALTLATRWNCSYSSQFLTSLFSNPLQGRDAESGGFEPPSALAEAAFEAAAIVHSANSPGKNSCQCSVISSFANKVSVVTLKMFCNDFTFCFQDKINVFPLFPFHTFIISLTFTNN